MATTGNHYNGNNQPRRKRNKKPVKRYSEEYSNRPNPYTGYTADGNYHPEAMKRSSGNTQPERARSTEEARQASINAALAEAAWGPAQSERQQPVQPSPETHIPPTVTVPPPKWAVSNNLTRQQLAAQEAAKAAASHISSSTERPDAIRQDATQTDDQSSSTESGSGGSTDVPHTPPSTHRAGGSHRRRTHRSKEENAKERAAKIEAKRAAVEKIAQGVAAHSVSEQMIDDISSMSDVMEAMPKQSKPTIENGVNWEEFYDAAFPPKVEENSKFAGKKNKQPKKRIDFKEDSSADIPMIVKPVMLGDDDLLPYDKITKENEREANEGRKKAKADTGARNDKVDAETNAFQGTKETEAEQQAEENATDTEIHTATEPVAAGEKAESKPEAHKQPKDPIDNLFPELESLDTGSSATDTLEDISDVVGVISIEEILASVEKQKQESAHKAEAVRKIGEFAVNTAFSFDSDTDDSWSESIPPRSENTEHIAPSGEMFQQSEEEPVSSHEVDSYRYTQEADIAAVDLSQFLAAEPHANEASAPIAKHTEMPSDHIPSEDIETAESAPEVIIDTAALDAQQSAFSETGETVLPDLILPELKEEKTKPVLPVLTDEEIRQPEVEVIISGLEDDIFAEEKITVPEEFAAEERDLDGNLDVEDKIEKLAEAAEIAEVFRTENEDLIADVGKKTGKPDIFNVSIDDIAVTPEITVSEDEEIKQYQPHAKPRESDDTVFESVLIVDDNPRMIDPAASAGQDETLFYHTREQSENPTAVFKLPDGPIVFPTDIDDAEFQEQWLDEDEDGDDMASRNKRTRRRISAFIGAVALLFAVMILFSAVRTVVSGFTSIGSTNEKKAEYTEFISPVVVNDPVPFETLEKADNNMLLKSSIWQALKELDETEGYEHVSDATNKIVLPAEMVEKAARELFGKDVNLNMNVLSEYDGSAIYYYDSIDDSFHITRSGITGPSPVITKIAQKSDHISLVVGYISQEEMSLTSSESNEEECYKFMEYILGLNSNGTYYIKCIRNYVED